MARKLLDAALNGCTSGQQQQHIPVLRFSLSREQMVTSIQLVSPPLPLKGYGYCFGGCPTLLSDLMVVMLTATNPWNKKGQNFGSFSIPLQGRPNVIGAGTMLEAAMFDCSHLFKNSTTSAWFLKYSGSSVGLFSPTWNILCWAYRKQAMYLFLHFNFHQVGGERTSQKQSQIKVTINFYSSKLCKMVKKREEKSIISKACCFS